ncbi:helix-turn-helix domain-containing protein [Nostoc sp. CALU 1950]|uniref:helix-turn-helix domain-containing protein n=1 Tax=Nostoc sp. CALU 1950 TaxID=3104321 RepID=UPI003EBF4793
MPVTKRLEILNLIRELRQQLNLSQKQFAAKVGVSVQNSQPLGGWAYSPFTYSAKTNRRNVTENG